MLKILSILLLGLMLAVSYTVADSRVQVAGSANFSAGDGVKSAPAYDTFVGFSDLLFDIGETSALYGVFSGRIGETKGGAIGGAFFPKKPIGQGLRVFFPVSAEATVEDVTTIIQGIVGIGAYWDVSSDYAVWGTLTSKTGKDKTGVGLRLGLSIGI